MDNQCDSYTSDGKQPRDLWGVLLMVRSLVSRLGSLFRLTEQDLKDAGVYLRQTRD